ncbi:MAG: hypothetical protein WC719_02490 [Patescibacteria group bacterium]|jgi:hypothetical protein
MEKFSNITSENKIEKPRMKEGVDFVFEQNPELVQIGTKEQYSEYLDTIFPESELKDIVYHGKQKEAIFLKKEKSMNPDYNEDVISALGIFFTPDKGLADTYGKTRSFNDNKTGARETISSLINLKNPLRLDLDDYKELSEYDLIKETYQQISNYKGDGFIVLNVPDIDERTENGWSFQTQIGVFEPEQIHVLGSKNDVDNFKNFVEHYS